MVDIDGQKRTSQILARNGGSRLVDVGAFVHLVLEKTLKALYVKKTGQIPPFIHDLARLAEKCGLPLDEKILIKFDLLTRFNLRIRYPDYRQEIYRMCNETYSREVLNEILEVRAWLLEQINRI